MRRSLLILIMFSISLLSACSQYSMHLELVSNQPGSSSSSVQIDATVDHSQQSEELTVWAHFDVSETTHYFQLEHPEVKVNTRIIEYNDITDIFIQACLDGNAPDVLVFDGNHISDLHAIDCLEDFKGEALFSMSQSYVDRIPAKYLALYSGFANDKLIGIPIEVTSAVTFYRADLLAANDFPSEPDELAEYIKDADRLLDMAKELHSKDIYIFQNPSDPVDVASMAYSLFDENLQFNRQNENFKKTLEIARVIKSSGLALRSSIWEDAGREALRSGQLAMIYLGSWGTGNLMNWAPDLHGKWRATELPLGLSGFQSGSALGIAKTSSNKQLAWEYIELMTTLAQPRMDDARKSYLGGQDLLPLIERSVSKPSAFFPSPIDNRVKSVWDNRVQWMMESDRPVAEVLMETGEYMELITETDRAQLTKFIHGGS